MEVCYNHYYLISVVPTTCHSPHIPANSVSMQVGPITHLHLFLVDIPALIPYT